MCFKANSGISQIVPAVMGPATPVVTTPVGETGQAVASIAKKRRSLLSAAGAIGDTSTAATTSGGAIGKPTLGA